VANLVVQANAQNLTTLNTWRTDVAGTGQIAGTTALAAPNVAPTYSAVFALSGADTVVGIVVRPCVRAAAPGANTVTVSLVSDPGNVVQASTTLNVADFDTDGVAAGRQGWAHFKFAASVTPAAGNYKVGIQASAATQISFYRDATAGNWNRVIVSNQAPAALNAGDYFFIQGDNLAATPYAVVQDNNSGTSFGGIWVSKGGTLNWDTVNNTRIRCAPTAWNATSLTSAFCVFSSGTVNVGTLGGAVTALSCIIDFVVLVVGQYALAVYGTFNACGQPKDHFKRLAVNAIGNDTQITVNSAPSGWLDNDRIALGSTSRTHTQAESGLLNGAPAGATFNIDGFAGVGGGLGTAHNGTAPTQCVLVNISRNVKIQSASAPVTARMSFNAGSNCDIRYVECYSLYDGWTAVLTAGCTQYFEGCSSWKCTYGFNGTGVSGSNALTFYNGCVWSSGGGMLLQGNNAIDMVTGTYVYVGGTGTNSGFATNRFTAPGSQAGNMIISSATNSGVDMTNYDVTLSVAPAVYSGNIEIQSCGVTTVFGMILAFVSDTTFTNVKIWRCGEGTGGGISISSCKNIAFGSVEIFGTGGASVAIANLVDCTFDNVTFSGDTSYGSPYGIHGCTACLRTSFRGGSVGVVSGIKTAFTTANVYILTPHYDTGPLVLAACPSLPLFNFTFGGATRVVFADAADRKTGYYVQRVVCTTMNGAANSHVAFTPFGPIATGVYYAITPFGGSANCIVLDPNYNDALRTLQWRFCVPAKNGIPLSIKFHASHTNGASCTAALRAYGAGLNVAPAAVTLGDYTGTDAGWTENTFNLGTPTSDGMTEVIVIAQDGAVTGNIYIDNVRVVGGGVNLGDLANWPNWEPPMIVGDMSGAGGTKHFQIPALNMQ
jgi:hypothetical protein